MSRCRSMSRGVIARPKEKNVNSSQVALCAADQCGAMCGGTLSRRCSAAGIFHTRIFFSETGVRTGDFWSCSRAQGMSQDTSRCTVHGNFGDVVGKGFGICWF